MMDYGDVLMSKKPPKPYKELRAKQKCRLADKSFRDIFAYCTYHESDPDAEEIQRLTQNFRNRVQALCAIISEDDAKRIMEKRLPGMVERARKELEQRKQLISAETVPLTEEMEQRRKWASEFPRAVGKGDALIKGYKRKYKTTRVQAMKELQKMGYVFPQEIVDRQYQIEEMIKHQKTQKKRKRKQKKVDGSIFHEDQDEHFYYIAGHTSGGAPYGVSWDEVGLSPFDDFDDEDDFFDEPDEEPF